jgi:Transcriptional activator of glycolytic enzymes
MPNYDTIPEQCRSLRELWDEYNTGFVEKVPFKKMEAWWGTAWRINRHKGWWTEHRAVYGLVLYFKRYPHPRSMEESLSLAEPVYQHGLNHGRQRNLTTSNQSIRLYMHQTLHLQNLDQTLDELLTEHQSEENW